MYHRYTPDRLEKKAEEILNAYKPELLKFPQAMDVYHFVESHLHLLVDYKNLKKDLSVLGCTCFADGKMIVWNDGRTKPYTIDVVKGTIFIDNALLDSEKEGRERFTVIHEASHQILHPRFYYKREGEEVPKIECTVYHIENGAKKTPMTDEEIREWQANRLGAALLMPARTVKMLMAERLHTEVEVLRPVYLSSSFVHDMASVFNVSVSAMSYRLENLNLLLK